MKAIKKNILAASCAAAGFLSLVPQLASAHGLVEYPMARQQICTLDGGYWWPDTGANIPNAACRAAFLESGTTQFVQNIEFASLTTDYKNLDAVKAGIPNGTLCAAGDKSKIGMDTPHPDWQTTEVTLDENGQFDFLFDASTPHNPSFWEFYLTKETFDPAVDVLSWDDLVEVDTAGNEGITRINEKPYYKFKVSLPQDRSGRAILYTRWQRNDVAGEGFYNCSDIVLNNGDITPPTWNDNGYFFAQGVEAMAGDEAWFRLFDATGSEIVFETLTITAGNESEDLWPLDLATKVNGSSKVQVGILQEDGSISFDSNDLAANKVYSKFTDTTFRLDVKTPDITDTDTDTVTETETETETETDTVTETDTDTGTCTATQYQAGTAYATGQTVANMGSEYTCSIAGWCSSPAAWAYAPGEGTHWQQAWSVASDSCGTDTVTDTATETDTDTATETETETDTVTETETDTATDTDTGCDTANYPVYPNFPRNDWKGDPSHALSGDRMTNNGAVFEAKWWTNAEPSSTAQAWKTICE